MALNNSERIGRCLDTLKDALGPYFLREIRSKFKDEHWKKMAKYDLDKPQYKEAQKVLESSDEELLKAFDVPVLILLIFKFKQDVFFDKLGHTGINYLSEILEARKKWAHQEIFSVLDAHRVVDTINRFLEMISAAEEAKVTAEHSRILLRTRYDEEKKQSQTIVKRSQVELFDLPEGLKPWREVIQPHKDVATGRYQQAEFAADLSKVIDGTAVEEYLNPKEFFKRTYVTKGILELLVNAIKRINKLGGDPVIQIKTAFGGGKTHSMLALYHMFGGNISLDQIPRNDEIVHLTGIKKLNKVNRAVIVGTALSPTKINKKGNISIHTIWGEIAYQLGAKEGYAIISEEDKKGVSPGSTQLVELLKKFSPSIIIIDELVAYARNIYRVLGLPAGDFDSILTFMQALTEAAKVVPDSMVVISIPESDMEIGGEGGHKVLHHLEQTIGRIESVWNPVEATEGFEIVRRRLFNSDKDFAARDAVVNRFMKMYSESKDDFPNETQESTYKERMLQCYPIHPEFFDRLYEDWSTLDHFQKTRGVLRLMAAIIHELWDRGDKNLLIMPGNIPLDAPSVKNELLKYLSDAWGTVVNMDIDGENSHPRIIDKEYPNIGKYSAAKKVARSIFIGSAPSERQNAKQGVEEVRIRLATIQPGDNYSAYSDALRRMSTSFTYLYNEDTRYWYDVRPTINKEAKERAKGIDSERIKEEIERRLHKLDTRGIFKGVHIAPMSSSEVPDDDDTRLIVLGPESLYKKNGTISKAVEQAQEILNNRGNSPRYYKNSLVFLAADISAFESLEQSVREFLAWKSIEEDKDVLDLAPSQYRQVKKKLDSADNTVKSRLEETYKIILYPYQETGTSQIEWKADRIRSGEGNFIQRTAQQLSRDTLVYTNWSPDGLLIELNKWNLFGSNSSIPIKKLWEYFASYPYLSRLESEKILITAINQGLKSKDYFGYAGSIADDGTYRGLIFGDPLPNAQITGTSILLKREEALRIEKKKKSEEEKTISNVRGSDVFGGQSNEEKKSPEVKKMTRYYASTTVDPIKFVKSVGEIGEHIVSHLQGHKDAVVKITLEVEAISSKGFSDEVVRIVSENSNTLKINQHGFEEE